MNKCPLCDGAGEHLVVVEDPKTGRKRINSEYCLCKKSEFVSDQFSLLNFLGGDYLPLEKVNPKLKFYPYKLNESPNYIIMSDFTTFCYHVKSVIMQYRFITPAPHIYLCRAIDILQKFHVPQEDGITPHISATNKFDLFIFTCDTYESNQKLDGVIAQVVNNRCGRNPTWIHITRAFENCKYEYSAELSEMIKDYKRVALDPLGDKIIVKSTSKNQFDAANFNGVSR
jgi:hypothetical protein